MANTENRGASKAGAVRGTAPFGALIGVTRRLFASVGSEPEERVDRIKAAIRLTLLCVLIAMIVYYVWPRRQSFLVDARTDILTITTGNETAEIWELEDVSICRQAPPSQLVPIAPSDGVVRHSDPQAFCTAEGYELVKIDQLEVSWPIGTTIVIRLEQDRVGGTRSASDGAPNHVIEVKVEKLASAEPFAVEGVSIPNGTLLRFPARVLNDLGVLRIAGKIRLGQTATQGTRLMLRDGTFEIKERFAFLDAPLVVNSGLLLLGEEVEVVPSRKSEAPLLSRAFVSIPEGNLTGLRVVLTTSPVHSRLERKRAYGYAIATSNWMQRIQADPYPVVLATLLSLLGGAIAVAQSFVQIRRQNNARGNQSDADKETKTGSSSE